MQGSIRQRSRLITRTKGQFMNLKEVLGDAYKEGMTFDEVANFFEGKKFADLSTGNYVDKNKYDSEVKSLRDQLSQKDTELKSKMSDDELKTKEQEQKDQLIKDLQDQLKANTITGNKNIVNSILAGSRDTLGVGIEDKDFVDFVNNITSEDTDKSNNIAKYVSKVIKDAYEKGKKDATKDSMGAFGKSKGNGSQKNTENADELGAFGKKLANINKPNKKEFDYFK